MSYQKILADFKQKKFQPIYLLHGDEGYFIDSLTTFIEKHLLDEGEKAFNQAVLYGKDTEFKQVVDEARQFPLMSAYRVVILKEAQDMRTLLKLETYAANPSPQTILVLAHKHKKFDKRKKLYKNIDANGITFESKKIYDNQLPQWINAYLQEKGYKIEFSASQMVAEYLGTDLSKVANELDKLILNLGTEKTIKLNHIQEGIGISKDYNVFELQKAIGERNTEKIFRIVNYFHNNEKANPLTLVISNLYTYFSKLYITAFNMQVPDNQLQRALGLPTPYFVKEYKAAVKTLGYNKIKYSFHLLKKADLESKGYGSKSKNGKAILTELLSDLIY